MVCTVEYGRMAAVERTLKATVFPEESTNEKVTLQTLHREFHDANEANLLKEEDMHVFDFRPLSDPLHLVCCNACQKPVKASQYAAHADRCRLLNSASDICLDLGGNSGHKKPPRKGRKNIQATNGNNPGAIDEQKYEPPNGNEIGLSESNFENHSSRLATQAREVQNTVPAGYSTDIRTSEIGNGEHWKKPLEVGNGSIPSDSLFRCQTGQILEDGTVTMRHCNDAPMPLATKVYYSQGNHRLRSELACLYRRSSTTECVPDSLFAKVKQENGILYTASHLFLESDVS